ncbi:ribonuclease H, partial [Trifolium pratense]
MNKDGAPGPDGFGAFFFQTYWDVIKTYVYEAVLEFFQHNWIMPNNYNANTIVLIPKDSNADIIAQFSPIALANFKFKIILKVLVSRQAIKIDIAKTFDTLDLSFLLKVLNAFGFSPLFCNWIHTILHSAKLSISINGKPKAIYFQPLVDKIKTKLASWKASLLSYAGRETKVDWHIFFDCEGSKEAWNVMDWNMFYKNGCKNRNSFVWIHSKISARHVGMKAIQAWEEWTTVQGIFDEQNQTIMQHNNRILQQPRVNPIAAHWTPPC